jgi:hypothetical protein
MTTDHEIRYALEPSLSAAEFIDVLRRSTLAERRPVKEPARIDGMLRHADVIVTARNAAGLLVGVSRAVTDFHFCCCLSDLAVGAAVAGARPRPRADRADAFRGRIGDDAPSRRGAAGADVPSAKGRRFMWTTGVVHP